MSKNTIPIPTPSCDFFIPLNASPNLDFLDIYPYSFYGKIVLFFARKGVYSLIMFDKRYDLEQLAECACFNLRKASRAITQYYDHALQPVGLRVTQFSILAALANFGTITITAFAKYLVMDRTTLTRNLRPLQDQELVDVVTGKDQRQRYLELTPKGRELLLKSMPYWLSAQDSVKKQLDETFESLITTTERIVSISTA